MTLFSPVAQIPYPALTDAPNMQTAMATMTSALDSMVVPRYASVSTLTTAVPSPIAGQQAFLTGSNAYVYWNGSAWVASAMALISSTALGSAASSVTLASIPQVFTHLKIIMQGGTTTGSAGAGSGVVTAQFNGDTTSAYWTGAMTGLGTGASGSAVALSGNTLINGAQVNCGWFPPNSVGTVGGISTVDISVYSSTTLKKGVVFTAAYSGSGATEYAMGGGEWSVAAAVTSIKLQVPNNTSFTAGSTFSLYGIP